MPSSCAFSCLLAVPIKATHRQLPLEWYSSMVWVGMKAWWVRRNKASPPKWLKYTNSPLHQCEHNTFKSTYSHENRTFWDFTQKCTVSSEHYVISAPLKIAFVRWKYSSVSCQGLFFAAPWVSLQSLAGYFTVMRCSLSVMTFQDTGSATVNELVYSPQQDKSLPL